MGGPTKRMKLMHTTQQEESLQDEDNECQNINKEQFLEEQCDQEF